MGEDDGGAVRGKYKKLGFRVNDVEVLIPIAGWPRVAVFWKFVEVANPALGATTGSLTLKFVEEKSVAPTGVHTTKNSQATNKKVNPTRSAAMVDRRSYSLWNSLFIARTDRPDKTDETYNSYKPLYTIRSGFFRELFKNPVFLLYRLFFLN